MRIPAIFAPKPKSLVTFFSEKEIEELDTDELSGIPVEYFKENPPTAFEVPGEKQ